MLPQSAPKRLLPLALRLLIIFLPFFVFILVTNPHCRFLFNRDEGLSVCRGPNLSCTPSAETEGCEERTAAGATRSTTAPGVVSALCVLAIMAVGEARRAIVGRSGMARVGLMAGKDEKVLFLKLIMIIVINESFLAI